MSEPAGPGMGDPSAAVRSEAQADLFADLVMQHANMAMVFCGAVPHPETGQPERDLEMARVLIDRLEMLQAKTRGNLGPEEEALLRESLAAARMAFVQAVQSPAPTAPAAEPGPAPAAPAGSSGAPAPEAGSSPGEEPRRKFVKKY